MESILNSIQSVLVFLLLTMVGFFFASKGWIKDKEKAFISKYLLNVAMPCTSISCMYSYLTMEMLRTSWKMLTVPALVCTVCYILSYLLAKALNLPRKTMGVFILLCAMPNTFAIGYPLCIELFGEAASPYILFYYVVCTFFTQTVGLSWVRWAGGESISFSYGFVKMVTAPTFIGVILGFVIVLLRVKIPSFLVSSIKYCGQTITALALLISGRVIFETGIKNIKLTKPLTFVMMFRFFLAPIFCFLCCRIIGVEGFPRSVFVIMSSMPVLNTSVVAAAEYGADEQLAAQGIALTTLASFVWIPVLSIIG